jgi:hypothetical protein
MGKVSGEYKNHAQFRQEGKGLMLMFRLSSANEGPDSITQAKAMLEEIVRAETISP